jgi:glycosyltransferase involved in cell wall biosynthesis
MSRHPVLHHHQVLVCPDLGGAGLIALNLARFLRERGQECRVWLAGPGSAQAETARLGLPFGTYDVNGVVSPSVVRAGLANWRFSRALKRFGPGIAHVHCPGYYGALRWGLKRSGLLRVAHVHLEEGPEILRWAFRSPPELIITCATFLVDHLRRILPGEVVDRTRIAAVPNAVEVDKFAAGPKGPAKARVGAPPGRPLALMLANLSPHKGQETAIRTAAALKARGVEVHFWLAGVERGGAAAYTARLQSLIAELGVADRVRLLGQRTDAPELLRAADLFLLPSTCEGLPISLLEAQACQVPVLAAPTAGVPEVVRHGVTGFLIPADDPNGFAEQITRLLADDRLPRQVTEAALKQVRQEHNWNAYCRRVSTLYEEIADEARSHRTGPVPAARLVPQPYEAV